MAQRLRFAQRLRVLAGRHVCNAPNNVMIRPLPSMSFLSRRRHENCRWIHSTATLHAKDQAKPNKKKEAQDDKGSSSESKKATQQPQDNDTEDDEVPEWQNPLHHNNPELEKQFPEDFAEGEEMPIVPLPPMAREGSDVQAPPHIHELADEILNLSMLEMKQLVDKVADHFGFDTQAVAMSLGGGGGAAATSEEGEAGAAEEEVVEEKTLFDLKLVAFDAKAKIKVIKEVRSIAGLGLKEAKEMVEGAPKVVKKDIKKEEAEELQKKLEEAGATIEVV